MAYNLQSLSHTLDQILHPDPDELLSVHDHVRVELQRLFEKTTILKHNLENLPLQTYKRLETLQRQVIDAAQKSQDMVEYAILDQVLAISTTPEPSEKEELRESFLQDLLKVSEEFDSLINRSSAVVDSDLERASSVVSLNPVSDARDMTVVGLGEDIRELQGRLTGHERELLVIPIVGMGGIGKTTLARKLYLDRSFVSHFDCVGWATISQEHDLKSILSSLVSCITKVEASILLSQEIDDLALTLYQSLFHRRYLIVLDDVWDTNLWDEIFVYFPDNNDGSRIMLTTRVLTVADYANSRSPHHRMQLLDEANSWDLFREKVFRKEERLDLELEELGRKIANNCKGLPLAITLVSGLLSESHETKGFWKDVADDISTAALLGDERFSKIFSLSYDNLPHHLRPCLLYIGAFPKDTEFRVSKIKRLWAAESFLKPIGSKSPEEVAEEYLEALANRNLLMACKWKSNGKIKSYVVHDLVRNLCIRKAVEENFVVCVKYGQGSNSIEALAQTLRRVMIFNAENFFMDIRNSEAIDYQDRHDSRDSDNLFQLLRTSRLLRVLDAPTMRLPRFPSEILELVSIRYLCLQCNIIPSPISRLQNLETFIFCPGKSIRAGTSNDNFMIPSECWELRKLRNFKLIKAVGLVTLDHALEKLQTLSSVHASKDLIERIPNIKKLGLQFGKSNVLDLFSLDKLESLKMIRYQGSEEQLRITFPTSVTKLTLSRCIIGQELMKVIGSLPCLRVLKLQTCRGPYWGELHWETYEDGFPLLEFLELGIVGMVEWITEDTHFPRLRHLVIRSSCYDLMDIPSCIGDIPTLEIMEIDGAPEAVVASARQIQEEQRGLENDELQVRIRERGGNWEL